MNLSSKMYLLSGFSSMALCWALAIWSPSCSTSRPEVAPVTVRDNPASFRPSFVVWTGWHPMPVTTSGSGGGFGFGK